MKKIFVVFPAYLGDKQIIFIIDGKAISYAESFMGYIEGYELATIVGQPTAGTNGNVNSFNLPGGYGITWTGMKVVKHDGSQHHGIGIQPDVYVNKTVDGIGLGKDGFLEKAIELTKSKQPE
ncbi:S41 family peptidase [Pricia sp. S334]|uniref:S41 family peptidase n=1 Tax=Pricia mediterranea TaxID=3076079 RepID=A0ABU3L6W5_9FLAO|nr:S41 family peptidase [Pricia sp. S334]MDT7829410.1 S41 family peptidase [Pricia sp. S334]